MAKATVQAALGPVMLRRITSENSDEERNYAEIILMVCIISIVVTAPIGAILITLTGPRLLTKTKQLPSTEGKDFFESFDKSNDIHNIRVFSHKKKDGEGVTVHRCMIYPSLMKKKKEKIQNCKRILKLLTIQIQTQIKLFLL